MNKDFIVGLVTGIAIAMTLSFFLFNYYIVSNIERAKSEVQTTVTDFREMFRGEIKDGFTQIREDGRELLDERKEEMIDKLKEGVKERIKNRIMGQDTTQTE